MLNTGVFGPTSYTNGGKALGGYSKARHTLKDFRNQGERMYGNIKKDVPELGL